jgi:membrane protease YdiL (CAAX protease family)
VTLSDFTTFAVLGFSFYGSLVVGYHWISQAQEWIGLRARFSPVSRKVLVFSAIAAIALVGLIVFAGAVLKWAGVPVRDMPPQVPQVSRAETPIALVLICILAPVAEELLFRGLFLDWLRQKMNVWIAAVALSVLFSLLHRPAFASGAIGWLTFTEAFLLGLAASALAIKYHSLRPSFVMHATLNVIGYIASVANYG